MPQEPREYDRVELVWPGKHTGIERVRLPFQTIERVNDVRGSSGEHQRGLLTTASQLPEWWPDGWQNRLIWGDNKYILASLLDELAGKVDFIYIDPPFATGSDFSFEVQVGDLSLTKEQSIIEETAYRDTWGRGLDSYVPMLFERLDLMKDLLSPTGTIVVHVDWHVSHVVRALMDEIFGAKRFINEIVWWYSGAGASPDRFSRRHDTLFWFSKSDKWHFDPDPLRTEYAEATRERFSHYIGNVRGGKDYGQQELNPKGKHPDDVIRVSIEAPSSNERTGYATQKPLKLMTSLVEAMCPPGGLVADFFAGSGTTLKAAELANRRFVGSDLSRFAIQTARKRLLDIPGCRPFEVQNLGRYERTYWQGIHSGETVWEYYRFILDLYQAQAISGFTQLHGQKASRFVHVGATDAPVTIDEVQRTLEECAANGLKAVDILGWEWEMGLNPAGKDDLSRKHGVDVRLIHIPREVMDKRAVDAGDVHFFELSVASMRAEVSNNEATILLEDFLPAIDEYMRHKVGDKAAKWSDWIDYWSVDFEHDGETYINQWQSYRTRKDPKLALRSAPHVYVAGGTYRVVVKVIDIFGNDTTQHLDVTVG